MPIRLNLLAEAQAIEEMRRRDPVKRAIWLAALLIAMMLVWASSLQLKAIVANKDLGAVVAQMNLCTNEYKTVVDMQKKVAEMGQKLTALHELTTNRFLNGTLLNALQQTTVEDVQLVHLKLDQTYLYTEGTKAKTNGSKVIPGMPPTITEKTVLTLDGNDSSENPGDQVTRIKEAIDNYSYFQENLDRANGVSWKNSSSPQLSPETGKAIVTFTLECRYPEKTR
ncbi:MAG: hypothetical protein AAB370_06625 [Verrucomicrobiota bacterium]